MRGSLKSKAGQSPHGRFSKKKTKLIRDKAFADRLNSACEGSQTIPPYHYGRLTWTQQEFLKRYKEKVSVETVHKWFAGEVRPRPLKMKLLARLIEVDEAWLSLGHAPDIAPPERKARNAMVDGVVNLVTGMIQMAGGSAAFPDVNDKTVDIFVIIKGTQYALKIVLAQPTASKTYKFLISGDYENRFVLGVIPTGTLQWDFLALDARTIDKNKVVKGGHVEVVIEKKTVNYVSGTDRWRQITSFGERL